MSDPNASCPYCRGEKDTMKRLLESLCEYHWELIRLRQPSAMPDAPPTAAALPAS